MNMTALSAPPSYPLVLSENRPLRFIVFFYLYAMQGVPAGFALTALANYLAAERVSSAVIGGFVATVGLPWSLQFVWGPFIDRFQASTLGRRRPWVLGAQLLALLASLGLQLVDEPVRQLGLLGAVFLIHSVFASVQDASVDAMAISVIPEAERGRINGLMRAGFLTGISLGGAGLALLLRQAGFHTAAFALSAFLLALTVVTFFIKERPSDVLWPGRPSVGRPSVGTVAHSPEAVPEQDHRIGWLFQELFRGMLARQSLWLFLPILVVYACQNAFIRAYNVHLIQQLGWGDTELSALSGTYGVAVVLGMVLVGGWLADRIGPRRLLIGIMLYHASYLLIINSLSNWWSIREVASAGAIVWSTMDVSLSVVSIPILMSLCRSHVEGSQFTAYMALVNLSDIVAAWVSGKAQLYVTAPVIGLVCGGIVLMMTGVAVWGLKQK